MELQETYKESFLSTHKRMVFIFVFFLAVLSIIFYTSFSGSFPTGKVIDEGNEKIDILANLESVPNISLDGEFNQVILRGKGSFIHIGDEKLSLKEENNNIIINNFDGDIDFGDQEISFLKGKVDSISVNYVPILPSSDGNIKIWLEDNFDYYNLEISESASVRKLDFVTSGTVVLDTQKIFNLNNEDLLIKNFYGDIRITNNDFEMKGTISSLESSGDQEISVSS